MINLFFKLESVGLSDIGLTRETNEDSWLMLPEKGIFILADGMGGHNGGEVASQMATELVASFIEDQNLTIKQVFQLVNEKIHSQGEQNPSLYGMGTTLICLDLSRQQPVCCHVGDSRLYCYRQGKLSQITKDHSLASEMSSLNQESLVDFPYKHILTRTIGTNSKVEPEITPLSVLEEDIYLLCSDGMTNFATDREIESALRRMNDLTEGVTELISIAKKNGGGDNITVILVKIHGISR